MLKHGQPWITLTVALVAWAACAAGSPLATLRDVEAPFANSTNLANTTTTLPDAGIAASSSGEDSVLSGEKALWPLVALALATMLQASRADNFPSEVGISPMRSSPSICAADLLTTCLWLLYGLYNGLGIRGSMRRMRRDLGLIRESEESRLSNGMPTYGLVIFAVAVVPQAILIFPAEGVPWTKAWAAIYFAAYLSSVSATFIGTRRSGRDKLLDDHNSARDRKIRLNLTRLTDAIYWVALGFHAALCIITAKQIVSLLRKQNLSLSGPATNGIIAGSCLGCAALKALGWILFKWLPKNFPKRNAINLLLPILSWVFAAACLVLIPWAQSPSNSGPLAFCVIVGLLFVSTVAISLVLLFDSLFHVASQWIASDQIDTTAATIELAPRTHSTKGDDFKSAPDLAESATEPAYTASGPAEPAPDPAAPGPDPAEPASDPAEPASDPAEPASDPEAETKVDKLESLRFYGPVTMLSDSARRVVSIAFAIISLAFVVMYYVLSYDSTGTSRPDWVDYFG